MNPYLIIAVLLAFAGVGAGGFKLGKDYEFASQAREDQHIAEAVDAANAASAQAIAKIKITNKTIQGQIEKQIETNTIYKDCKIDSLAKSLVDSSLLGPQESK